MLHPEKMPPSTAKTSLKNDFIPRAAVTGYSKRMTVYCQLAGGFTSRIELVKACFGRT